MIKFLRAIETSTPRHDTLLSNATRINNGTAAGDTGSSGFTFQYQIISIVAILLIFYVLTAFVNMYFNYKDKKENKKIPSELNKIVIGEEKNYNTSKIYLEI